LLESIAAMTDRGWRVIVAIPDSGPLTERVLARGGEVVQIDFPVLRRASASPLGIAKLALTAVKASFSLSKTIRRFRPDAVYVNTVTLPWWLLAARIARTPSVCHVHEAEIKDGRAVRTALTAPLLLATVVMPNSRTTLDVLCDVVPRIRRRAHVVYNGVPGPPTEPSRPPRDEPIRLVVVGRLSPRKAPDVALEAVAQLREQGRPVHIELCGSTFSGYEWFEDELRERAAQPDLKDCVTFSGYVSPTWPALERSRMLLAPSLGESFGNAVVEGQLAMRPVIATSVQGHLETIQDGETGILVPPGDPSALADAIKRLLDDLEQAEELAANGRSNAQKNFSVQHFRTALMDVMVTLPQRTP
jgi:glycosyltransferase involved in cell wall biosynthesis